MNKLLIATAIGLISTGAFATDQHIGESSEYYQSPLADHGPGAKTKMLAPGHDHGDDTQKNFVDHDHDMPVAKTQAASSGSSSMPGMHDHGDDVRDNYIAHEHK